MSFETKRLPAAPDALAPDGSEVRLLPRLQRGSLAHFQLPPEKTSIAVCHRTVEEIWFVVGGQGEMWRKLDGREEIASLEPGVSLTIPIGTHFQFRSVGAEPFAAVGVTMPPWPGPDEAFEVAGKWPATESPA